MMHILLSVGEVLASLSSALGLLSWAPLSALLLLRWVLWNCFLFELGGRGWLPKKKFMQQSIDCIRALHHHHVASFVDDFQEA